MSWRRYNLDTQKWNVRSTSISKIILGGLSIAFSYWLVWKLTGIALLAIVGSIVGLVLTDVLLNKFYSQKDLPEYFTDPNKIDRRY